MKRMLLLLALLLGALLLGSCAQASVPAAETPAPSKEPEPSPEPGGIPPAAPEPDAAERRLASMSLEEKVCQMLMLCSSDEAELAEAASLGAGGLCLYADSFAGRDRDAVLAMTQELQAAARIPLLLAVDEEGGTVCRVSSNPLLRPTPFAAPRTLFRQGGWPLVESDTEEKAALLLSLGLNVNLAPVADVPLNPWNYIYDRSFSTDPAEAADYVRLAVTVMKREGIGCALKHFPGYGGSADTHAGQAVDERPYEAFAEGDFLPFAAGIEAGADAVLVSHNIVRCMDETAPASLSPAVHRILREELGFSGVVLCDDLRMEAITQFTGGRNAAVDAALAGSDLLCCGDFNGSAQALLAAAEDGLLPEARIDASVLRILRWKLALGLDLD
ncbi:MAG: glycoside hydrolase family 3 N-terminal domain-containing protein [Clostridia bacterium]